MTNPLSADEVRKMIAACPKCCWCGKRCVGGQVDGDGVPSHYTCQIGHRDDAPPNP